MLKYKRKLIKTSEMHSNTISVGDMRDVLQRALDSLDGYDDNDKIILDPNTYGISKPYIELYDGFISLSDIGGAIEYADEAFGKEKMRPIPQKP